MRLLLLLQHQLAKRWSLLQLGVKRHPETVFWCSMPQLDIRLAHNAVLLQGEGAGEEGLGDTYGRRRGVGLTDITDAETFLLTFRLEC